MRASRRAHAAGNAPLHAACPPAGEESSRRPLGAFSCAAHERQRRNLQPLCADGQRQRSGRRPCGEVTNISAARRREARRADTRNMALHPAGAAIPTGAGAQSSGGACWRGRPPPGARRPARPSRGSLLAVFSRARTQRAAEQIVVVHAAGRRTSDEGSAQPQEGNRAQRLPALQRRRLLRRAVCGPRAARTDGNASGRRRWRRRLGALARLGDLFGGHVRTAHALCHRMRARAGRRAGHTAHVVALQPAADAAALLLAVRRGAWFRCPRRARAAAAAAASGAPGCVCSTVPRLRSWTAVSARHAARRGACLFWRTSTQRAPPLASPSFVQASAAAAARAQCARRSSRTAPCGAHERAGGRGAAAPARSLGFCRNRDARRAARRARRCVAEPARRGGAGQRTPGAQPQPQPQPQAAQAQARPS